MAKRKPAKKPSGVGGTYKIDPETGELVQVSAGIPKVASKGRSAPAPTACGRPGPGCGRC
jgi:hypothetical protein